jgi:phenylalanyl-tRNA synthetase beta chain
VRVGLEWLREWVPTSESAEQIAQRLTTAGLEVDAILEAAPHSSGIVVARVAKVRRHPKSERLSICSVQDARGEHTVVCGAPNVTEGIKAAFAPPGSELPDGRKIGIAELVGTQSSGMLCSAAELGLGEDADGILILEEDAPIGEMLADYLQLADSILDVDLTPNRGDCFSMLGIARESAASLGSALPSRTPARVAPTIPDTFPVTLAAKDACPRFAGRVVRGIDVGARTPLWMRERLRRAGVRSIHPVVDVTNYVMLELGQPLHGYDLNKLRGGIEVRFARNTESVRLLDGNEVNGEPNVLVIADESGAVGLAGIMGGASTAVEGSTRDVFLEAAYFSPGAIAGRARQYALHTDASLRFERGVDPEQQVRAIERATELLLSICGGAAGPVELTELAEYVPQRPVIHLRRERLEALLGLGIEPERVEALLARLELGVIAQKGSWRVTPPAFRFDLCIEEDLIEEVGRMLGYDAIPMTTGPGTGHLGLSTELRIDEDRLADILVNRGYSEVINFGFVDEKLEDLVNPGEKPVRLRNPISQDLNVMRRSLWPGLLATAQRNLSRQQERVRIFELGNQFVLGADGVVENLVLAGLATGTRWPEQWGGAAAEVDYFDVKADIEALLAATGRAAEFGYVPAEHPALRPGQTARIMLGAHAVGWLGVTHPSLERRLDLKQSAVLFGLRIRDAFAATRPAFHSYPKFPVSRRDLAVVVDEGVSAERLIRAVREAAGELLRDVVLFDVYRGTGIDSRRKSVALGLILQGSSRTLTDVDADQTVQSVTQHLERELGATIRT